MDGWQGAGKRQGLAQFGERQVGLLRQQALQLLLVGGQDLGLAAREAVAGTQILRALALGQQLLDHPQRHAETPRHLIASALPVVIGRHDPFT